MKNHVILGSRGAMQVANALLLVLVTESIDNWPGYIDVNRVETRSSQCDRLRLHVEYLNPASIPFGDPMKASVDPSSPALNAVWTAQVHGYRKSFFWRNMWRGSRKAVWHSHACQRDLRVSFGANDERGGFQQREMLRQFLPEHALKHRFCLVPN